MPLGDKDYRKHRDQRNDDPPQVLYKYMTCETARLVLSTGKLRFKSPIHYNDPFDSQWNFLWPLYTPEAQELQKTLARQGFLRAREWPDNADPDLKKLAIALSDAVAVQTPEIGEQLLTGFVEENIRRGPPPQLVRRIKELLRRLRVVCFSARDDALLMWSHYADQHRGVVLAFDCRVLEDGLSRLFRPLEYRDSLPETIDAKEYFERTAVGVVDDVQVDLAMLVQQLTLTKHSDWSYEKEWRCVTIAESAELGDYSDYDFAPQALKKVIFGCRSDQYATEQLDALSTAFNRHVETVYMTKAPARLAVVPRGL